MGSEQNLKKAVLLIVSFLIVLYVTFSFMAYSLNPGAWHILLRVSFASLALGWIFFILDKIE
jgi:uncharacterized membrane protein